MNPFLRNALRPLGGLMEGISSFRNQCYDRGWLPRYTVSLPIISVGNLTIGGTGKTPVVIALADGLKAEGKSVAILSRGYGRSGSGTAVVSDGSGEHSRHWKISGDEPVLMAKHLPSVPVIVDANRVRGAEYVQQHFHPDILLLDDAFQHRRLNRTMDIVLLNAGDAEQDYRLFPAGRLRERWNGLQRADLILITKSNLYTIPDSIQSRLNDLAVPFYSVALIPKKIRPLTPAASSFDFNNLPGKSVLLCSGIGDPESFKAVAEMLKIRLRDHLVFRDHHSFDQSDLKKIKTQSHKLGVDLILTTEKDAVRLESLIPPELPAAALQVGIELTENIKKLILHQLLP